jgi:hypothetical protein
MKQFISKSFNDSLFLIEAKQQVFLPRKLEGQTKNTMGGVQILAHLL